MNPSKNYLVFCPLDSFGGLEMQSAKRASDAVRYGNSAVLVCKQNSRLHKYAGKLNLNCEFLNVQFKYIDISAAIKLGGLFKKYKTDICIVPTTKDLSIAVLARNLFSKKTKIVLYQQMQSGLRKIDFFHNWIYRNLDYAIVITEQMKLQLPQSTIFPSDKISVIPCGIESEHFLNRNKVEDRIVFNEILKAGIDANAEIPKVNNGEGDFCICRNGNYQTSDSSVSKQIFTLHIFIIGYIARFDQHKDQLTAVKAFAKADIPDSLLVLVGEESIGQSGYTEQVTDLIEKEGLSNKVLILPFNDEIPALMSSFDLFILPSRSETLGLVLIEAMMAACPVIGTNSGGVPEIIKHNETGLLFEQTDFEKLSEQIKLIYSDIPTRERLAKAGQKFAIEHFEYEKQSRKFFEAIANL
ncbi:MAG: glycosyltransferase family 4 protein [Candidatus Kapabacteria bacterium]|nr:glycosyltransferase family 4 protein [Candidatus Kapabacteria bacterium]